MQITIKKLNLKNVQFNIFNIITNIFNKNPFILLPKSKYNDTRKAVM
jgi:hypothetical protein